jgi:hypothetical protein
MLRSNVQHMKGNRMKKIMVLTACLALTFVIAGCTTTGSKDSALLIGKSLAFDTAEAAPAQFDSWTFFWCYPSLEKFDSDLEYVVLCEGKEYYVHDCGMTSPGGSVRSDFWKTMFKDSDRPDKDLITPFHGKNITVVFRATKGRLRFPAHGVGGFAFYKTGKDGKTDRKNPLKQIEAVLR